MHEDSSYDSDCETGDGHKCKHQQNIEDHDDVCRTFSDTLAAEYKDYVTISKTTPFGQQHYHQQHQQQQQSASHSYEDIVNDPIYSARVEFGVKLGYTEAQVFAALSKLGPRAGQNELLEELIKLGASANKTATGGKLSIYRCGSGANLEYTELCEEKLAAESCCNERNRNSSANLRPIVIDGSNVAMSHGNKETFSCRGIKICVDWFKARGHREITVFVPMWRKETARPDAPIKDQEILMELEAERLLVFTPSRSVGGRRMVCYDDRYILKLASENDGIVVSNDNYRDLTNDVPEYKKVVEERLLMYTFVNDRFMPPDDPLGRHGPSLDNFLRKKPKSLDVFPSSCPYGKKCTYGNKCKYYHPERGNQPQKTVTERLVEQAKLQLQARNALVSSTKSRESSPKEKIRTTHTGSLPPSLHVSDLTGAKKSQLTRTNSVIPAHSMLAMEAGNDCWSSKAVGFQQYLCAERPLGVAKHNFGSSLTDFSSTVGTVGDHLGLNKKLSDPEQTVTRVSGANKSYMVGSSHAAGDVVPGNLHKKLQRQLTLNPTYDPRLIQMTGYQEKAKSTENVQVGLPAHRMVERVQSDTSSPCLKPQPHQIGMSYLDVASAHPNVTRISSAPDSYSHWPPSTQSYIAKLNSTSDSRLNLAATLFPPPSSSNTLTSATTRPGVQSMWTSTALPGLLVSPSTWQHSTSVRPSSVPPQVTIRSPTITSPVPRVASPSQPRMTPSIDDQRYKLYFHLSSIFPEQQVRAAMEMYPDETNPQRICAAILSLFSQH